MGNVKIIPIPEVGFDWTLGNSPYPYLVDVLGDPNLPSPDTGWKFHGHAMDMTEKERIYT